IVVIHDIGLDIVRIMDNVSVCEVINICVNVTLSSTILTSGLTMLVIIVLDLVSGITVHNFSLVIIVGIVVGTYLSIYVAGVGAGGIGLNRESFLPTQVSKGDNHIL
ncbi:protein translocase subunit SecF, partial [Francisella tularensis subsp. holarctica]|nr:protein translocase subunit SecF [Francisella tularensis subsp. holarctica]